MPRYVLGEYHQEQARTRAVELRLFGLVVLAAIGLAGLIAGHGSLSEFRAIVAAIQDSLFSP